jgi:proline dehydrogenase
MNLPRRLLLQLSSSPRLKQVATEWPLARRLAGRFVAGTSLADALDTVEQLNRGGAGAALNFLGEHTLSEAAANTATTAYAEAIEGAASRRLRAYCSVKPSQVGLQIDVGLCQENVRKLLLLARAHGAAVRLDMEDSSTTDNTLAVTRALRAEGFDNLGVVLQSYLYRTDRDVGDMNALGISVRLCKGAYSESPAVAYPDKIEVDRAYARQSRKLLGEGYRSALATHDPRLIRGAMRYARQRSISTDRYSFEMLLGIRRDLQERLITTGDRLTVYVPYGSEWYPYLMRRLAERPANLLFFLRAALRA